MANRPGHPGEAPRITPAETQALMNRGQAEIVDVRSPEYFANGHIPGAISVPLNRLGQLFRVLPRGKPIVFY